MHGHKVVGPLALGPPEPKPRQVRAMAGRRKRGHLLLGVAGKGISLRCWLATSLRGELAEKLGECLKLGGLAAGVAWTVLTSVAASKLMMRSIACVLKGDRPKAHYVK